MGIARSAAPRRPGAGRRRRPRRHRPRLGGVVGGGRLGSVSGGMPIRAARMAGPGVCRVSFRRMALPCGGAGDAAAFRPPASSSALARPKPPPPPSHADAIDNRGAALDQPRMRRNTERCRKTRRTGITSRLFPRQSPRAPHPRSCVRIATADASRGIFPQRIALRRTAGQTRKSPPCGGLSGRRDRPDEADPSRRCRIAIT